MKVELQEYLSRIGLDEPGDPSPSMLRALHESHLRSVPFENLDIHRGVPIILEEERILEKIVWRRRGGFCYELNYAFSWLLTRLGYEVTLLSAEVAHPGGGFGIPFDHMALRVSLDGAEYLADVGFGDSFVRPLRLVPDLPQEETEHVYRVTGREDFFRLERRPRGAGDFAPQYRFTLTPRQLSDYRSGCEYHQTSKNSPFTQKVVATRALEDGRVTLTRERLILHTKAGRSEAAIPDEAAWRDALVRHFGLNLEAS